MDQDQALGGNLDKDKENGQYLSHLLNGFMNL